MELGIAGAPDDLEGVVALCGRIGVDPVFVIGPGETLPRNELPLHIHHVPHWNVDACLERLGGTGLAGLWAASAARRRAVAEVAARMGFPHLPCPRDEDWLPDGIAGVRLLDIESLGRLSNADCEDIPLPAWVRSAGGNGDSSCMRVDHPDDLSLATGKLEKRRRAGSIRIQPVLEGPAYRLMAFKTGRDLVPFDIVAEDLTTSAYRVPLGFSMPVPRRGTLLDRIVARAEDVNRGLPHGWGYLEMEFVESEAGIDLVDLQCPASLDPLLREVVHQSQGVDLLQAVLQCAAGQPPLLTPARELGVAAAWLLTRSGVVTGFKGVEEARGMPGVQTVRILAEEGDVLSHVVDTASRDRGGYIVATGATADLARARFEAARETVWINTSPAIV